MYLYSIRSNIRKYFLLVGLLFAVAFSSAGKNHPVAAAADQTLVFGLPHLPHDDLDEVHQPLVSGGQVTVQKNLASAELLPGKLFNRPVASFENFIIKASLLLVKDHLAQNYPSHNFW